MSQTGRIPRKAYIEEGKEGAKTKQMRGPDRWDTSHETIDMVARSWYERRMSAPPGSMFFFE